MIIGRIITGKLFGIPYVYKGRLKKPYYELYPRPGEKLDNLIRAMLWAASESPARATFSAVRLNANHRHTAQDIKEQFLRASPRDPKDHIQKLTCQSIVS